MRPKGFRTEASGTIWTKSYRSYAAAARALEALERKGYSGAVNQLGGKWRVRLRVDSFLDNPRRRTMKRRSNPGVSRHVRVERARKSAAERRVATALANYLRKQNPGMKTAGAKVQKLKGGVLKITPIRAPRRPR